MDKKKGQLSLSDAPTIVLLVGLVFLVMATIAFIGSKYGTAMGSTVAITTTAETITPTDAGVSVSNTSLCNFGSFAITAATNATAGGLLIDSANYSTTAAGVVTNLTSEFTDSDWVINYTGTWGGTACIVTGDLETEVSNNTSIAGIVLTISLVGIVLTVLIGIFLVARAPNRS